MIAYESVDFPDPFGPMIACTWFDATSRSTPLTISVPSSSATCRFSSLSVATLCASVSLELAGFRRACYVASLAEKKRATLLSMPNIGTGEIILLLLLALLLFGAKRLPEIGRSLGTGMKEFKDSVTGKSHDQPELPQPTDSATSSSHERETV